MDIQHYDWHAPKHKNWRDYSASEVNLITKHHCRGCPYLAGTGSGDEKTCDYILITGNSRGCRPEVCMHYQDNVYKYRLKTSGTTVIKAAKSERYWTEDQTKLLMILVSRKTPYKEIAKQVGRTEKAVRSKVRDIRNGRCASAVDSNI